MSGKARRQMQSNSENKDARIEDAEGRLLAMTQSEDGTI
jgi:hypothetical protein